jgi:hypothetical protein
MTAIGWKLLPQNVPQLHSLIIEKLRSTITPDVAVLYTTLLTYHLCNLRPHCTWGMQRVRVQG